MQFYALTCNFMITYVDGAKSIWLSQEASSVSHIIKYTVVDVGE